MKKRWIVLLVLLSFTVTFILHAPADRLYAWAIAGQENPPLQLYGVQGTLSEGSAKSVRLDGRTLINDVKWTLQPAWLLLLRLSVKVESSSDIELHLKLSRSPFGRTRIDDVHVRGEVKQILAMATPVRLPVEGELQLSIDSAQFEDGLPVQVDGLAELNNLRWTLARDPLVLGSFNANLASDDKGVLAQLASGEAPLDLAGEARLELDRKWDLQLNVKPRPNASPEVLALIRSLGSPDNEGRYQLRRNGQL